MKIIIIYHFKATDTENLKNHQQKIRKFVVNILNNLAFSFFQKTKSEKNLSFSLVLYGIKINGNEVTNKLG